MLFPSPSRVHTVSPGPKFLKKRFGGSPDEGDYGKGTATMIGSDSDRAGSVSLSLIHI